MPLMIALILINGLNATSVLFGVGLFYIASGLYYRIPMPVQPLKAFAAVAISLSLSTGVITAGSLLIGIILLTLSLTNLIMFIVKLFPQSVVRGIQLSIGLILLKKGIELAFSQQIFINVSQPKVSEHYPVGILLALVATGISLFFKRSRDFPPSLALLTFGLGIGVIFAPPFGPIVVRPALPTIALLTMNDFWLALTLLVIPQLPLTLGNAVVSTADVAKTYFKDGAYRVNARALTASMGLANILVGPISGMPMCHGSGGLTAHYRLGARTGGANVMVGGLFLIFGLLFGATAVSLFSLIPVSVFGVLLAIVGIYHAFLTRDLMAKGQLLIAGAVAGVTVLTNNLAFGFGTGILLYHLLRFSQKAFPLLPEVVNRLRQERCAQHRAGRRLVQ